MKKKVALITGVSGQDGAYLSKLLLEKGYIRKWAEFLDMHPLDDGDLSNLRSEMFAYLTVFDPEEDDICDHNWKTIKDPHGEQTIACTEFCDRCGGMR